MIHPIIIKIKIKIVVVVVVLILILNFIYQSFRLYPGVIISVAFVLDVESKLIVDVKVSTKNIYMPMQIQF